MPQIRRRRAPAQETDEHSDAEGEPQTQRRRISAGEGEAEVDGDTQGVNDQDQMVKNLVRLALAKEHSRGALRRNDINEKVLGAHTRQFKPVFQQAQQQLRAVFGMEMTELPAREKVTIQQKRAAAKSQSQSQKIANAWILTSTLPAKLRDHEILPPPKAPTAETESQYAALYSFVISCIMLNGGTLADSRLDRYLSRVNAAESMPLTQLGGPAMMDKTEKLQKRMEKDGYIVKVRDTTGGDEVVEWIVGPRGKVEVGDQGVRGMVQEVYGDVDDPQELDRRLERSLGVLEARPQEEGSGTRQRGKRRDGGEEEEEEQNGEEQEDGESEAE